MGCGHSNPHRARIELGLLPAARETGSGGLDLSRHFSRQKGKAVKRAPPTRALSRSTAIGLARHVSRPARTPNGSRPWKSQCDPHDPRVG